MFGSFDFQEFLSAFIVLFAVIDIICLLYTSDAADE